MAVAAVSPSSSPGGGREDPGIACWACSNSLAKVLTKSGEGEALESLPRWDKFLILTVGPTLMPASGGLLSGPFGWKFSLPKGLGVFLGLVGLGPDDVGNFGLGVVTDV